MAVGMTPDAADALLETWRANPTYAMVHTGDPGDDGSANVSAGDNTMQRVHFMEPSNGVLIPSPVLGKPRFINVGTDETLTHLTVWNGPTGPGVDQCLYATELETSQTWSEGDQFNPNVGFKLRPLTTGETVDD
jgi:hypothetical protein